MKTQKNGQKTSAARTRNSALSVIGKNPDFDYCFRKKSDIQDGGGEDMYAWSPVKQGNSSGEEHDNPLARYRAGNRGSKTAASKKEITHLDVVLCRRPKEVGEYFQSQEDQKYNAGVGFIKSVSKNAREKFRDGGADVSVKDSSRHEGPSVNQRMGTTEVDLSKG